MDVSHSRAGVVTIDRPMVLIPAEEYSALLAEAGYLKTPKLDREIRQARLRFKRGKYLAWEKLKSALKRFDSILSGENRSGVRKRGLILSGVGITGFCTKYTLKKNWYTLSG